MWAEGQPLKLHICTSELRLVAAPHCFDQVAGVHLVLTHFAIPVHVELIQYEDENGDDDGDGMTMYAVV
jgi:hypothetical protein